MLEVNKIHLGDCLELMKQIDDKSIDMILCDLPYGTTSCRWDTIIPFKPLWEQYNRIIKENGVVLLFGVEPFSSFVRLSNVENYKYDWYWNKKHGANFMNGNKQPIKNIETVSTFYKKQPTYNPQKTLNPKGEETRSNRKPSEQKEFGINQVGTREKFTAPSQTYEKDKLLPKCLIEFSREFKPIHPTQKPEKLYEYFIKTYTNEGDLILDNCCGSGTIGVAKTINRNFIGVEKDEKYYDIAVNRVNGFIYTDE